MPTVLDVARYILERHGPTSVMKLQKLVYYSQAWSLVWEGDALFSEEIEAWAFGPVVPDLYQVHKGRFRVSAEDIPGDPSTLNPEQCETVNIVVGTYGRKSPQWLSALTHREDPWRDARKGVPVGAISRTVIPKTAMQEYYDSLTPEDAIPIEGMEAED